MHIAPANSVYLVMHRALRVWQLVPGSPECAHFLRKTQRDSDVRFHSWEGSSDQDITVPKMLDHFHRRMEEFISTKLACESIGLSPRAMASLKNS